MISYVISNLFKIIFKQVHFVPIFYLLFLLFEV